MYFILRQYKREHCLALTVYGCCKVLRVFKKKALLRVITITIESAKRIGKNCELLLLF